MSLARMQADLNNEGYTAGYCASKSVKENKALRDINIGEVQDHLVSIGNITATHRSTVCVETPGLTDSELQAAVENLSDTANLEKVLREPERAKPFLLASFASSPSKMKAQTLCHLGDTTGVAYLVNWFQGQSMGTGVSFLDLIPSPDIPPITGTIWALGQSKDARAIPVLSQKLDSLAFPNRGSTDFSHARVLILALGNIGDPSGAPALKRFMERSNISGNEMGPLEWQASSKYELVEAIIELLAAAALYKCGDIDNYGRNVLINYHQNDWRGVLVRYAGFILSGDSTVSPVRTREALPRSPEMMVNVYPNPFGPTTTIFIDTRKHIPARAVQVSVFTVTGRRIKTLDLHRFPVRGNSVRTMVARWDNQGLASGIYFIKIKAGPQTFTRRVTLVK
jgi:hypothetical protein